MSIVPEAIIPASESIAIAAEQAPAWLTQQYLAIHEHLEVRLAPGQYFDKLPIDDVKIPGAIDRPRVQHRPAISKKLPYESNNQGIPNKAIIQSIFLLARIQQPLYTLNTPEVIVK